MTVLSTQLQTLGRYLVGEFDNQAQSLQDPTWYVHLKMWFRPVHLFEDSYTVFIEQMSVASQQPPYRQRLLRLSETAQTGLVAQYYGLKQPLQWQHGGEDPGRLSALTLTDLIDLPTCRLPITPNQTAPGIVIYQGRLPSGTLASFEFQGTTRYLSLGFDVGPVDASPSAPIHFRMYDKGIDPATGQGTWGALMGPFDLVKVADFT